MILVKITIKLADLSFVISTSKTAKIKKNKSQYLFLKFIKKYKIDIKVILLKNDPTINSSPKGPDNLP